ncbi:hypothetical protein RRG08_062353 [Elysia crispata]|uniref:Uncharacterized protein n=1 Tax=Elysia crispata TaxID=231223 RepID=A0AAE0YGQ0_9GAST|nr:hypothetical protein RRG08_062353 [Elysia crispata]
MHCTCVVFSDVTNHMTNVPACPHVFLSQNVMPRMPFHRCRFGSTKEDIQSGIIVRPVAKLVARFRLEDFPGHEDSVFLVWTGGVVRRSGEYVPSFPNDLVFHVKLSNFYRGPYKLLQEAFKATRQKEGRERNHLEWREEPIMSASEGLSPGPCLTGGGVGRARLSGHSVDLSRHGEMAGDGWSSVSHSLRDFIQWNQ